MHSILIIGCGSIGERHLRCFQATGRVRLTACETNPSLLKTITEKYGVEGFADWTTALAQGHYDAVVICTPAHLHIAMAIRVLEAGLHVLIEKPLSQSMTGIDQLVAARDRSGKKVAVAYVLRGLPLLAEAREFIQRGELGPVLHATVTSGQYFPGGRPAHVVHYSKTYYRDRAQGGGAIQDALTHMVNWTESVVGPSDSVMCDCAHLAVPEVTVEDTVNVSSRNGAALVNYTLNQFQAPNETTMQFNTAQGSVKVEMHLRRWGTFRLGDSDWQWRDYPALDRDGPFVIQATAFLDWLDGAPSRLCSLDEGLQTLRFNLSALASAEANARVYCQTLKP